MTLFSLLLDLVLIGLLIAGVTYAFRLSRQLAEMRASRAEMERFVLNFNAIVSRAEAGIRGLKNASRESGDDLERLIEKANLLRDELHFLTESADQIATRLSDKAATVTRGKSGSPQESTPETSAKPQAPSAQNLGTASATERDLLRVLRKSG